MNEVSGLLSSWFWNLHFFSGGCNRDVSGPSYCDLILGGTFESVQGHQALSQVDGEIGDFGILARPMRVSLEFQCVTSLLLKCDGNIGIPFPRKQRNRPSSRDEKWKRGSD